MPSGREMARGTPSWTTQRPAATTMALASPDDHEGVITRPMRLKVLYTIDAANTTNCLARWPHVLSIQTIDMDASTTIGLVDLYTCIQAVMECSPELTPRMDMDYTVYAYDYSECDHPLVGQGMLSKALAAAAAAAAAAASASSSTSSITTYGAPHTQNRSLVTGRVCKNIQAMINKGEGVKESLEVKLRLVPVPKDVQHDYVSAMERYRAISTGGLHGAELVEWAKLLQQQPAPVQPSTIPSQNQHGWHGQSMEVINQLLSPSPSLMPPSHNTQSTRSVMTEDASSNESEKRRKALKSKMATGRPRVSKRQSKESSTVGGNTSGYEEGTDADEGPQPKKRAKTTQTDWKSKQTLESGPDSLRVAASTAGSLRLFRPIASSVAMHESGNVQELARAPTPVPEHMNTNPSTRQEGAKSLRRQSLIPMTNHVRAHVSPYGPGNSPQASEAPIRQSIESQSQSPDFNGSTGGTPPNIPSSPPIMRYQDIMMRSSPPCPSSPELPPMPRDDSGFMSASIDDLFGDEPAQGGHRGQKHDSEIRPMTHQRAGRSSPARDSALDLPSHDRVPGCKVKARQPLRSPRVLAPKPQSHSLPPPLGNASTYTAASPWVQHPKSQLSPARVMSVPRDPARAAPNTNQAAPVKAGSVEALPVNMTPATDDDPITRAISAMASVVARQNYSPTPSIHGAKVEQCTMSNFQLTTTQPPAAEKSKTTKMIGGKRPTQSKQSTLIRTASVGSLNLPKVTASDPVVPPPPPPELKRAKTTTYTEMAAKAMELPPEETVEVLFSRTAQAKREANQRRLEEALKKGEMPPYCENCGAIETPTWRKAWMQQIQGPPAYYEYSDLAGRVTMVVILGRDANGTPTSHLIVKKFLSETEKTSDYKEYYLCNPCGIWMSKYKCNRPEDKWDRPQPKPLHPRKRPTQRAVKPQKNTKTKASNALLPTSEADFPQSEPCYPTQETHNQEIPSEPCPPPAKNPPTQTAAQEYLDRQRHVRHNSERPAKSLNPMTSTSASTALVRATQSSPARWGSQHTPIDLDDSLPSDTTRRVLFPSPRKDDMMKTLGGEGPVVNVAKVATQDTRNKENLPPLDEPEPDADAHLRKIFEKELGRPVTPVQDIPLPNPFKTPTRPASTHRPITRSITRSGKASTHLAPSLQGTPTKTPGSLRNRRSPRNQSMIESPFTTSLNFMMSQGHNDSPSRQHHLDLDFGTLPDLPPFDAHTHADLNFGLAYDHEDFFSTDVPMPSSPPKLFQLYEDPDSSMQNINWDDFADYEGEVGLDRQEPLAGKEVSLDPLEDGAT